MINLILGWVSEHFQIFQKNHAFMKYTGHTLGFLILIYYELEKQLSDIMILHHCTKNYDHMIFGCRVMTLF